MATVTSPRTLNDSVCFKRETSGQVTGLRDKLEEVNWTVGAVNHTVSNGINIHHLKIHDLQVRAHQKPAAVTFTVNI